MAGQSRAASGDPNFECCELTGKELARDGDIGLVTRFGRTCSIMVLTHCLANAARCGSHRGEGGAIGVCYILALMDKRSRSWRGDICTDTAKSGCALIGQKAGKESVVQR